MNKSTESTTPTVPSTGGIPKALIPNTHTLRNPFTRKTKSPQCQKTVKTMSSFAHFGPKPRSIKYESKSLIREEVEENSCSLDNSKIRNTQKLQIPILVEEENKKYWETSPVNFDDFLNVSIEYASLKSLTPSEKNHQEVSSPKFVSFSDEEENDIEKVTRRIYLDIINELGSKGKITRKDLKRVCFGGKSEEEFNHFFIYRKVERLVFGRC